MAENTEGHKQASEIVGETAQEHDVPDRSEEVLRDLLRETEYLTKIAEKARIEQKDIAERQLKSLSNISTAASVFLLLVLVALLLAMCNYFNYL